MSDKTVRELLKERGWDRGELEKRAALALLRDDFQVAHLLNALADELPPELPTADNSVILYKPNAEPRQEPVSLFLFDGKWRTPYGTRFRLANSMQDYPNHTVEVLFDAGEGL